MKIGTITFHWANNYGAVLQAYALQQFLKNEGYDTEIIDYKPAKLYFRELIRDAIFNRKNLTKRRKIRKFVKKHIYLSDKIAYQSNKVSKINAYDTVICGSDQIWNAVQANPVFFLDFVKNKKRISYAASMGNTKIPEDQQNRFRQLINNFDTISVREQECAEAIGAYTDKDIDVHIDPYRRLYG